MFSKKTLRVVIQNMEGEFYPGVSTIEFKDLPIEVKINKTELPAGLQATINIYGASKRHMNSITTIQWLTDFIVQKAILVYANDGGGEKLLFQGNIMNAQPDYGTAPDVKITINACAGAYYNLMSDVPPSSLEGEVPVHLIFQKICNDYGIKTFRNHGVVGKTCKNPRVDGFGMSTRLFNASKAYDVYVIINNSSVDIYPNGENISGTNWKFTPKTYIGYPTFTQTGISLKLDSLYDVNLMDYFIIDKSEVTPANDRWHVIKVSYDVSTKIGGKWIMAIEGVRVGVT